jgi:hypothetical protein
MMHFANAAAWESWLAEHHQAADGVAIARARVGDHRLVELEVAFRDIPSPGSPATARV